MGTLINEMVSKTCRFINTLDINNGKQIVKMATL